MNLLSERFSFGPDRDDDSRADAAPLSRLWDWWNALLGRNASSSSGPSRLDGLVRSSVLWVPAEGGASGGGRRKPGGLRSGDPGLGTGDSGLRPFDLLVTQRTLLETSDALARRDDAYGFLLGELVEGGGQGPAVLIDRARPGPGAFPGAADEAERFRTALGEAELAAGTLGRRVVGWYHGHRAFGPELTQRDRELHLEFFPEPWQCALVLAPRPQSPRGAFIQRLDERLYFQRGFVSFRELFEEDPGTAAGRGTSCVTWVNYRCADPSVERPAEPLPLEGYGPLERFAPVEEASLDFAPPTEAAPPAEAVVEEPPEPSEPRSARVLQARGPAAEPLEPPELPEPPKLPAEEALQARRPEPPEAPAEEPPGEPPSGFGPFLGIERVEPLAPPPTVETEAWSAGEPEPDVPESEPDVPEPEVARESTGGGGGDEAWERVLSYLDGRDATPDSAAAEPGVADPAGAADPAPAPGESRVGEAGRATQVVMPSRDLPVWRRHPVVLTAAVLGLAAAAVYLL